MRNFGRMGKKDAVCHSYFTIKMVSRDFIVNFLCRRSLVRIFRYRTCFFHLPICNRNDSTFMTAFNTKAITEKMTWKMP